MRADEQYVVADDVDLQAVESLPVQTRQWLNAEPGNFVLTRARGRASSKVIDAAMAGLLGHFADGKSITDAVVDFSRVGSCDPMETLEAAFPVLEDLINAHFLAPVRSQISARVEASLRPGESWAGVVVLRPVHVLNDCEVYQGNDADGRLVALKKGRSGQEADRQARQLQRETTILTHLAGACVPAVYALGAIADCAYIVTEWCPGTSVVRAAARARAIHGQAGSDCLLNLCAAVAEAYAELHERGVIHGDVHPGNVLVAGDDSVRLIDFGAARLPESGDPAIRNAQRTSAGYFIEPEYAATMQPNPDSRIGSATFLGEQHLVAHLIYRMFTGHGYAQFAATRAESMQQLIESQPEPFDRWGISAWPDIERVLRKALSREPTDRFGSVRELAKALRSCRSLGARPAARSPMALEYSHGDRLIADYLRHLSPDAQLFDRGLPEPPYTSITFGSAGIAYFLYRQACIREDATLLSWAKLWIERSFHESATMGERGFVNPAEGLTRDQIGRIALYHTASGLQVVKALVGQAMGDQYAQLEALQGFAEVADNPCDNIDVTLGWSGVLLGAAMFEEMLPAIPAVHTLGARLFERIWTQLAGLPVLGEATQFPFTGIAHGWAGVLYAMLRWCRSAGSPAASDLENRLDQLADWASPSSGGLCWERKIRPEWQRDSTDRSGGWCNGTAGMIHLWTRAHQVFGDERYLQLAEAAARHVVAMPVGIGQLCCGLPGQAYGLLNLYKHTGERQWLNQARALGFESVRISPASAKEAPSLHFALFKGALGTALLWQDLETPDEACMPMFEPQRWR